MSALSEMASEYRRFAEKLEAVERAHAAEVAALEKQVIALKTDITTAWEKLDKVSTRAHLAGQICGLRQAKALWDAAQAWCIEKEIKRLEALR